MTAFTASGGDDRLTLTAGRTRYRTGLEPLPGPSWSSCTANPISRRGYAAAIDALSIPFPKRHRQVRDRIRDFLDAHRANVILTASGTDSQLVATAVARPDRAVLVAPNETGSGSQLAAAGRRFSGQVPSGRRVEKGEPLVPVEVVEVKVRDGVFLRSAQCVEAEIAAAISERTLIHVVDGSKTGLRVPSANFAATLGQPVLVDAAQGRYAVRTHLDRGWMVSFTGSKFWGGPPFSGALLVPYAPPDLIAVRDYTAVTPGLLFRWEAALAEMEAWEQIPDADVVADQMAEQLRQTVAARFPVVEFASRIVTFINGDTFEQAQQRWLRLPEWCRVGQPVNLDGAAGWRVAVGAPNVIDADEFDPRVLDPLEV